MTKPGPSLALPDSLAGRRHLAWDWNGTLLDDVWLGVETINLLLGRRGLPPLTLEDYLEHFDFPVSEYYRRIGFDFDSEPFEVMAMEFIEEYTARRFECGLHADVREALDRAREVGLSQSILSAYHSERLRECLDHYKLADFFRWTVGLDDHYAASKIEAGRRWMRGHDLRPEEILLIGDTIHDHEVAEELGVGCALIARGHQKRERLEARGVPVFASLAEMFGLE
jgi:phosphoglycolate phosphatase